MSSYSRNRYFSNFMNANISIIEDSVISSDIINLRDIASTFRSCRIHLSFCAYSVEIVFCRKLSASSA